MSGTLNPADGGAAPGFGGAVAVPDFIADLPGSAPNGATMDDAFAALHGAVDLLNSAIAGSRIVTAINLQDLERAIRRLHSAKLSLVAKADRQRVADGTGASSTGTWIATATKTTSGSGASDVKLATALEESLPVTKAALGEGELSREAAAIIARTMNQLPDGLTDGERCAVEDKMVRDARVMNPSQLGRSARFALEAANKTAAEVAEHQESVLVAEERKAYQQSTLTMHDHGDGTTTLRAKVPTPVADVLRTAVQTMISPRRDHLNKKSTGATEVAAGAVDEAHGDGPQGEGCGCLGSRDLDLAEAATLFASDPARASEMSTSQCDCGEQPAETGGGVNLEGAARNSDWNDLDFHHKQGRALVDLLEHLDTTRLHGKVGANIVVTMTLEQALAAAKAAEFGQVAGVDVGPSVGSVSIDTGTLISTGAARRLACNAGILPMILGRESVPLDLGRRARFFSENQRVALATQYRECAADGCDRPYSWCELHHEDPYSTGGRTDLSLAVPLCGHHHRAIHDESLTHTLRTDPGTGVKTVTFLGSSPDSRPLWDAA